MTSKEDQYDNVVENKKAEILQNDDDNVITTVPTLSFSTSFESPDPFATLTASREENKNENSTNLYATNSNEDIFQQKKDGMEIEEKISYDPFARIEKKKNDDGFPMDPFAEVSSNIPFNTVEKGKEDMVESFNEAYDPFTKIDNSDSAVLDPSEASNLFSSFPDNPVAGNGGFVESVHDVLDKDDPMMVDTAQKVVSTAIESKEEDHFAAFSDVTGTGETAGKATDPFAAFSDVRGNVGPYQGIVEPSSESSELYTTISDSRGGPDSQAPELTQGLDPFETSSPFETESEHREFAGVSNPFSSMADNRNSSVSDTVASAEASNMFATFPDSQGATELNSEASDLFATSPDRRKTLGPVVEASDLFTKMPDNPEPAANASDPFSSMGGSKEGAVPNDPFPSAKASNLSEPVVEASDLFAAMPDNRGTLEPAKEESGPFSSMSDSRDSVVPDPFASADASNLFANFPDSRGTTKQNSEASDLFATSPDNIGVSKPVDAANDQFTTVADTRLGFESTDLFSTNVNNTLRVEQHPVPSMPFIQNNEAVARLPVPSFQSEQPSTGTAPSVLFNAHIHGKTVENISLMPQQETTVAPAPPMSLPTMTATQQVETMPSQLPNQSLPLPPPSAAKSPKTILRTGTVEEMVADFLSHSPAPQDNGDVPRTLQGVQQLASLGRWSKVEQFTTELLLDGSKGVAMQVKLKGYLLLSCMQQRNYERAGNEMEGLGDLDSDVYRYETYSEVYVGKSGTFMPMQIRFIHALLPRFQDSKTKSEDRLNWLIARLESENNFIPEESGDATTWIKNARYSLLSSFLQQRRFELALRLCRQIQQDEMETTLSSSQIVTNSSRLARIYLQMGDLKTASSLFALVEKHIALPDNHPRIQLNAGLLAFANDNYIPALSHFENVVQLAQSKSLKTDGIESLIDDDADLLNSAANNLAICALYCCDVKRAVQCLESLIQSDPARHLKNVIVFNLSTLYDLACDNASSTMRKQVLQHIAKLYGLDNIDCNNFRI